jgi:hypothetical protein
MIATVAQLTAPGPMPAGMEGWLQCLFWLAGAGSFLTWGYRQVKPADVSPQPLRIRHDDPPLSRSECVKQHDSINQRVDILEEDVRAIRSTMATDKADVLHAGEQRASMLVGEIRRSSENSHKRMDLLTEKLGEVSGELRRIKS